MTFGSGRSGRSAPSGYRDWDAARLARERPRCPVPNQPPGDRFFRARPCAPPSRCYGAGQLGRGALWGPSGGKIRKIRTFPLCDFIEFDSGRLWKRSLAGSLTGIVSVICRQGSQSARPRRRGTHPYRSSGPLHCFTHGRNSARCPRAEKSPSPLRAESAPHHPF